jgi:hypothetical protein
MVGSSFAGRLRRFSELSRSASGRYGMSRFALAMRLLRIYRRSGIRPVEAIENGLLDPTLSEEMLAGCFGKTQLLELQDRLNPRELTCLTEDKAIFYPLCSGLGVPVPALFAVIGRGGGWTTGGVPLADQAACLRYLYEGAPDEFVVKPAAGVYGEGVGVLRRDAGGFVDHAGRVLATAEFCEKMFRDPKYDRFILQERLKNHPDLEQLTGSAYLQTVRIATLVDRRGDARVIYAEWKLIAGDLPTDNYSFGRSGNYLANIALETGALGPAMTLAPDGVGSRVAEVHPRTGRSLVGYRLPGWDDLVALARRCALLFQPLRTVGWDIGVTARGPVVIEGNRWWDPPTSNIVGPQAPGVALHPIAASADLLWQ